MLHFIDAIKDVSDRSKMHSTYINYCKDPKVSSSTTVSGNVGEVVDTVSSETPRTDDSNNINDTGLANIARIETEGVSKTNKDGVVDPSDVTIKEKSNMSGNMSSELVVKCDVGKQMKCEY